MTAPDGTARALNGTPIGGVGLKYIICQKCASSKVKIVPFETEGKKFAVCDDCGCVQSIGMNLKDRYSKWKQYRESPAR